MCSAYCWLGSSFSCYVQLIIDADGKVYTAGLYSRLIRTGLLLYSTKKIAINAESSKIYNKEFVAIKQVLCYNITCVTATDMR